MLELDRQHGAPLAGAARVVLRERLADLQLQAIPVLQGTLSIRLWIPVQGLRYDALRAWLQEFSAAAAAADPALLSIEPNTIASGARASARRFQQAPRLTLDAAMLLVDQRLHDDGSK